MTTDNYPSWDAKAWLAEFEPSKMVQGGTRPVRAKVFQSTLEIVTKGGYKAPSGITIRFDNLHNGKTLRDNVFCEKEISLKNVEHKYTTEYKVVNQDCLAYAKTLFDQDYTDDLIWWCWRTGRISFPLLRLFPFPFPICRSSNV